MRDVRAVERAANANAVQQSFLKETIERNQMSPILSQSFASANPNISVEDEASLIQTSTDLTCQG